MTKLTDTKCRAAKPGAKDQKLSDGNGLYLLITKHGSKLWKWKYRYNGVEKKLNGLNLGILKALTIALPPPRRAAADRRGAAVSG